MNYHKPLKNHPKGAVGFLLSGILCTTALSPRFIVDSQIKVMLVLLQHMHEVSTFQIFQQRGAKSESCEDVLVSNKRPAKCWQFLWTSKISNSCSIFPFQKLFTLHIIHLWNAKKIRFGLRYIRIFSGSFPTSRKKIQLQGTALPTWKSASFGSCLVLPSQSLLSFSGGGNAVFKFHR